MTAHWVPWTLTDTLAAVAEEHGPHVIFPKMPTEKTRMCPICRRYVPRNLPRVVVAKRAHHFPCFEAFTRALDEVNLRLTEQEYEIVLDREDR